MAAPDKDDALVTYTVRELLDQLRKDQLTGFTKLDGSLAGKADKADVARMEARLDHHAKDIADLQQWRHDKDTASGVHVERDQRWSKKTKTIWAVVTTLALILATLFGPALANAFS